MARPPIVSQERQDLEFLLAQPQFRRFLFRVIQSAGIYEPANVSEGRYLLHEGRRQMGLEILDMCEAAQPAQHPDKIPILTVIQVLREETQKAKPEKQNAERYDRTTDIAEPDEADPE